MQNSADAVSLGGKGAGRSSDGRRAWLKKVATVVIGSLVALVPLAAGVLVLLDPLRRRGKTGMVRVATLEGVPDDGLPRMFPVIDERSDAWSRYPKAPIGAVYLLRREGEAAPVAYTATCPHAGCFIGYAAGDTQFRCPCHTSTFELDGKRIGGEASVAPRDMDTLEVELRGRDVWVRFVRFRTGRHQKIAVG